MTNLLAAAAMTVEAAAAALSNSVVQADYSLVKSAEDRSLEVTLRCWCPVCGGSHRRSATDSERGVPATLPGFVLSPTEVLVPDPGVRKGNLGGISVRLGSARVAAREKFRIVRPRAVVLETERPLPGARPLEFAGGAVSNWFFMAEHEGLRCAGMKSRSPDDGARLYPDLGVLSHRFPFGCIGLDGDGVPSTVSLLRTPDAGEAVTNSPCLWPRVPADSFERAASALETAVRAAAMPVVISLDPPKRDFSAPRFRYGSDMDDDPKKTEFDAVGLVVGQGLVLVPSTLVGEQIGRVSKIEARLPDGRRVRMAFDGAFAEWNAIALRFEGDPPAEAGRLEVAPSLPAFPYGTPAWSVSVENKNGTLRVNALRGLLNGQTVVRDGEPYPVFSADAADTQCGDGALRMVFDGDGRVLGMRLSRRYGGTRWNRENEDVPCRALARLVADRPYNPEFSPRVEDDRNRLVWLGVETVALTDALAREKNAQSEVESYSRPPLVTEVYPGSPADKAGIRADDILLAVRRGGTREQPLQADDSRDGYSSRLLFSGSFGGMEPPWPNVENSVNTLLTRHGAGARLTLVYFRSGVRREAEIVLEAAPVHYRNAKRARNRTLGLSVADMTFEVRRFFKFADDAPGVVVAKVKPGSPAQVAGLKPYELVTEVNGSPVSGAKDFAAKVKGAEDLTLSVRRLAETRVVRIRVAGAR